MTRLAIVVGLLTAIAVGGFFIGQRWDDARDAKREADTLERILDADTSTGDADADRNWVSDFVDGLFSGD